MPKINKTEKNLKVLAITHLGIADITAKEAFELVNAENIIINKASIVFEVSGIKQAVKFAYASQSVQRAVLLCAEYNLNADSKFTGSLKEQLIKDDGIKPHKYISKKTFASRFLKPESNMKNDGSNFDNSALDDLSTLEIEALIGEHIHEAYNLKVDLKQPDLIFLSYFEGNKFYLGIDIAGFDLSKRDYRLFTHPSALKGTVAYSLLRIADYGFKEVLIDPFCGSGTIIIEACLFKSRLSPHYYKKEKFLLPKIKDLKIKLEEFDSKIGKTNLKKEDLQKEVQEENEQTDKEKLNKIQKEDNKNIEENEQTDKNKKIQVNKEDIVALDITFNSISSSKKNSKIANIIDYVRFSRCDISWLDTKFDEKTVDKIITNPPRITKTVNAKDVEKVYKELFYQAEFILKQKGTVTVVTTSPEVMKQKAAEYKFKVIHERELWHGQEMLNVVVFGK